MRRGIDIAGQPRSQCRTARRLYERLGFRVTHEDQHKVYMRRQPRPQTWGRKGTRQK
jgi:hypothetical protein